MWTVDWHTVYSVGCFFFFKVLDCALPKCIVCAGSTTNADLYQQCRLAEYASKVGNKQCLFAPIYKKYKKRINANGPMWWVRLRPTATLEMRSAFLGWNLEQQLWTLKNDGSSTEAKRFVLTCKKCSTRTAKNKPLGFVSPEISSARKIEYWVLWHREQRRLEHFWNYIIRIQNYVGECAWIIKWWPLRRMLKLMNWWESQSQFVVWFLHVSCAVNLALSNWYTNSSVRI